MNESMDQRMAGLSKRMKDLIEWGDESLVAELVEIFLKDTPPRVQGMAEGLRIDDVKLFIHNAHALKGSSANMGANALAKICGELETLGRANKLDDARKLFPELEKEFQGTLEAVEMLRPVGTP